VTNLVRERVDEKEEEEEEEKGVHLDEQMSAK
jgi:hypothetical protein